MNCTNLVSVVCVLTLWAGCSSEKKAPSEQGIVDAGADLQDAGVRDAADAAHDSTADLGPTMALKPRWLFAPPAVDPLAGSSVQGCARIDAEQCVDGKKQRCTPYDTKGALFVDSPDPLLHRVLRYDRWYDLYHQPDGMSFSRHFNRETLPGTPEAEWGKSERFSYWGNSADAAIWSGTALVGFAARYVATRTRADYLRFETKARALLSFFEVTGIPGYLARHHFLALPPGGPKSDQHMFKHSKDYDHTYHSFDPSGLANMPSVYTEGALGTDGERVKGTPMWRGRPSIDQYSGVLAGIGAAYPLLEDATLKARFAHHVGCYLKRLERIEVRNLQQNKSAMELIQGYFADGTFDLDPGDIDLAKTDTLIAYVLRQPNSENKDTFDSSCPKTVQLKASKVLDAASPTFLIDMLRLVGDMQSSDKPRGTAIDHVYANVRGGNAVQLMSLALLAYQLTGEDQYRDFLLVELIQKQRALDVADTMTTFVPPGWCRAYHADHIVLMPLWSLVSRLDSSPLKDRLLETMAHEIWNKRMKAQKNGKFDVLFAGEHQTHPDRTAVVAEALELLGLTGGNGGLVDDPRRGYTVDRAKVLGELAQLGNEAVCPTEAQRALCEDGVTILGISLPGDAITQPCTGAAGECKLSTGCAWAEAKRPLPLHYRRWGDFVWQKSPYEIGYTHEMEGSVQSAGLELTESYWLARSYGLITEGAGQVLAWKDVGACN